MSEEKKTTQHKDDNAGDTKEVKKECQCSKRVDSDAQKELRKKLKNITSVVVLLAGVAVGSFFFDIAQLIRGEGFSQKALRNTSVVEYADKTWVSYDDPKVTAQVFTADDCENCFTDEVLVWLRRIVPTVTAQKRDVREEATLSEAQDLNLKHIPAFVFDKDIENTDFFQQASILFEQHGEYYILRTAQLGVPVGEYIALPDVSPGNAIVIGEDSAPVTIVEYSDFTCEFCKTTHPIVERVLAQYGEKIQYVYKHLPLPGEAQAVNASLAAECAHEQEKFVPYANILFARQSQWSQTEGDVRFNAYARELRLDTEQFGTCLSERKYEQKVADNLGEALSFGISATPTLFINDRVNAGVVTYEGLKELVDEQLATMTDESEATQEGEGESDVVVEGNPQE